jgi:predicted RNA-binding Zn-ribbon protein involved in translation (DUF1610 family)
MMPFDIGFIKAETHTPEYLMHKYWARKPHNVISECISVLTSEGDTVIDPFCGSGVTIREGALLGRKCTGYDLNPAAVLISSTLINPPSADSFVKEFESIYDKVYKKLGYLYLTEDGRNIKYLSHRIIAKCECGETLKQEECRKEGKKYVCPKCGGTVRFNLVKLVGTEIFNISIENDKAYIPSESELERQKSLSEFVSEDIDTDAYNFVFPENRRILAFKGISTSSFFTNRNYCILACFANYIWEIKDKSLRDCALLLLTASAAQCSRLIASRNNLSTGGPAWSVPGFWVPQEHLETNPFVHFKARLKKFKKALDALAKNPITGEARIIEGNSLEIHTSQHSDNVKAALIFLEPPYGDSVPYTEFSNIWNSFLKCIPASDDDISVSDRLEKAESWKNYNESLDKYMNCFTRHLTEKGKLLITFNNNDMRAWTSLISALQNNGFICQSVFYQIPAVISSKAQMSLKSSYISDVYSVYTLCPDMKPTRDLSPLMTHLRFIANSRGGRVAKTILDREFIIAWLKNNIDHNMLSEKDSIIGSMFDYDKKTTAYRLKEEYREQTELLKDAVIEAMKEIVYQGSYSLLDSYLKVSEKCERFGTMELAEFKEYTEGFAVENGKVYGYTQLSIFDLT